MAQMMGSRLVLEFRDECLSKKLLPYLAMGVLMGVTETTFVLLMGSPIFFGDLAPLPPLWRGDSVGGLVSCARRHLVGQFDTRAEFTILGLN
jgi:hypothetical protein